MCLLLGATGVGKTLLLKRLQTIALNLESFFHLFAPLDSFPNWKRQMNMRVGQTDFGEPPPTLPTVGTNLTDLTLKKKKVTVRELGGCMGPIWPSYYSDCSSVIFVVDSANINQVSSSCIQLLSVLSAELLKGASILVVFNKIDIPCPMTITEMKSLFRLDDIIASAPQSVTVLELSARSGQGLQKVLDWLESIQRSVVEQHV